MHVDGCGRRRRRCLWLLLLLFVLCSSNYFHSSYFLAWLGWLCQSGLLFIYKQKGNVVVVVLTKEGGEGGGVFDWCTMLVFPCRHALQCTLSAFLLCKLLLLLWPPTNKLSSLSCYSKITSNTTLECSCTILSIIY